MERYWSVGDEHSSLGRPETRIKTRSEQRPTLSGMQSKLKRTTPCSEWDIFETRTSHALL